MKVHFHGELLGDFEEEVSLAIDGSPTVERLVLHGTVVGPSIHFDMPKLNFGTVLRLHVKFMPMMINDNLSFTLYFDGAIDFRVAE